MASSGGRRHFGRVDPFCLFMVLPLVLIAGILIVGGLALVGVVVIVIAAIVILIDSWTNRPLPFDLPDEDYDYEPPPPGRRAH
ncbi:hypothetical protein F4560_002038 [Saccharothrix ecbatanensis]|uniref:Uncharacterized protein n=1 Tax=Saccharothrix ecbatanensis TaxID=1105145 RepID=A0A7W9LZT9_9PSEU|nr:hypothetical protein [Saccharothrix ecbatanensis]MBB5802270.1 hypothetical protein [Saccharothrix ecbatanensis]